MTFTERVAEATRGRDRTLDAIKSIALLVVIIGHSLAWHTTDGTAVNVLEEANGLIPLTWVFQVLPLFFAAGAVSNAASLRRTQTREFLTRRVRRLLIPVLVYAGFWTLVMTPLASVAGPAGTFLSQLLWFAAIYLMVVTAAPWTARWASRPRTALSVWFILIVAVDMLRLTDLAVLGWLNLFLVWGWLHQVGYTIPRWRGRPELLLLGLGCIAAAVLLSRTGPYSTSLITVAGDEQLSNLAPPSMVLALYGLGQILIVCALWDKIAHVLRNDRIWAVLALVGARGMGMYLWHIPLVAAAAGTAIAVGWEVPALSWPWWLVHIAVVILVVPTAWVIAGFAEKPERAVASITWTRGRHPGIAGALGSLAVLNVSVTGFATLSGDGALGLPSSSWLNVALLVLALYLAGQPAPRPVPLDK